VNSTQHHRARIISGLLILMAAFLLLRGYVTDDTYIHLRYAENVAERGDFAFNPGERTYGATSPLWIFGLVGLLKLGITGPAAAWTLGLLSGVLVVVVLAGILQRLALPESWRWWTFMLGIVDAWFLRWTMSGMETPLATAALLVLLWPLVMEPVSQAVADAGGRLWLRYLGWGVAAGLASLIRPEFLLLAPAALPWLLLFEYRRGDALGGRGGRVRCRPHAPFMAALGGWVATAGPWLVYAQMTFGRWSPGTASAKSNSLNIDILETLGYLLRSFKQLGTTQGVIWLFLLGLIVLMLIERMRQQEQDDNPRGTPTRDPHHFWQSSILVLIVFTWVGMLLGGYAIKRVWTISRYLSPLSPVVLLSLSILAYWLTHYAAGFRGQRILSAWVAVVCCSLNLLANVGLLNFLVRPHVEQFSAGVKECYLEKGVWIGENSPPDAVIAALDIGALAYGSDRKVLDLMGLVSPEIRVMGLEMGFQAMVESGAWLGESPRPQWFVDRWEGPPRWDGKVLRGVAFELVDSCVIHGVGVTEPQDWTVATYRLTSAP